MPELPCVVAKSVMSNPPEAVLRGEPASKLDAHAITAADEPRLAIPMLEHDLIGELFEHALGLGHANDSSDEYQLDRWLAPRLHSLLRVPRRIASQRRFWAWIAMKYGAAYVFQRFGDDGIAPSWRFTGDLLRNAVSRLWWAAELLRDGSSYSAVDLGLRRVRTAQFALELKYSWLRPAAVGFVSIAEDPSDRLTDNEMKALSVRANVYLPLMPLEAICLSATADVPDDVWWGSAPTKTDLLSSKPPAGPNDGVVDQSALASVMKWYGDVLREEREATSKGGGIED
jgi:hypothetical protein